MKEEPGRLEPQAKNVEQNLRELTGNIELILSMITPPESFRGPFELIRLLRQIDVVLRQAYPGPVNPNPPSGTSKLKCPHCGKDIP